VRVGARVRISLCLYRDSGRLVELRRAQRDEREGLRTAEGGVLLGWRVRARVRVRVRARVIG
jgi:hypothetical protein